MDFSSCAGCGAALYLDGCSWSDSTLEEIRKRGARPGSLVEVGGAKLHACKGRRGSAGPLKRCVLAAVEKSRICPGCGAHGAADLGSICRECRRRLRHEAEIAARPRETALWGVDWSRAGGDADLSGRVSLCRAARAICQSLASLMVHPDSPPTAGVDLWAVPPERWIPDGRMPVDSTAVGFYHLTGAQADALRGIMARIADLAADQFQRGRALGSNLLLSLAQGDRDVLRRMEEAEKNAARHAQGRRIGPAAEEETSR
jgi:hypothetical protein